LISAAGYLDKYGPAERYNLLQFAARSPCPALYFYGSQEVTGSNVAFTGLDAAIRNIAADAGAGIDVETISGGDHFYSGCTPRLAKALVAWPRWRSTA
jgi:hypothetical protein